MRDVQESLDNQQVGTMETERECGEGDRREHGVEGSWGGLGRG